MKSTGTVQAGTGLWQDPNTDASNSSGFTGLPGGSRNDNGSFTDIGGLGYWWSSTQYSSTYTFHLFLVFSNEFSFRTPVGKTGGLSVRCLRD